MVGKTSNLTSLYTTTQRIKHSHYKVTKSSEQHQLDLLYVPHNLFEENTFKYILTDADVASRYKVTRALRTKKASEVAFVLKAIYKKGGVFKYPKVFQYDDEFKLNRDVQSCLKNTMLTFEEQQQNINTATQLLWKPLTKSLQSSCLSPWMLKSFKALKKDGQFGLKI